MRIDQSVSAGPSWAGRVFTFIALAGVVYLFLHTGYEQGGADFMQFYNANIAFYHRQNPYAPHLAFPGALYGTPYPPLALWLTAIPALFPLSAALPIWDVACALAVALSFYGWLWLARRRPPVLEEFGLIVMSSCLAPLFWVFSHHQLLPAILLFGMVAFWLQENQRDPFWVGLMAGLMCVKFNVVFLCALWLLWRSSRRGRWLAGFFVVTAVPWLPFVVGYRPLSDLHDMWRSMRGYSTNVLYFDDQNIVGACYRLFWLPQWTLLQPFGDARTMGVAVASALLHPYLWMKLAWTLLVVAGWLVYLRTRAVSAPPMFVFGLSLALGVIAAPYSHFYDGVLCLPLFVYALMRWGRPIHWCAIPFFLTHYFLAVWLGNAATARYENWNHLAFTSFGYLVWSAAMLAVAPKIRA